jgi:zinc protease
LDAATLSDVRAFHDTFYRPSNATLIVAGDFDRNQLDAWVNKYFTGIQNPNASLPRVSIKEPARTAMHRYTEYGANVPLPAVEFTYLIPPKADADIYALRVAQAILAAGESSRLYRSLVYEQQLAQSAEGSADLREDAGLFVFKTTLASGKSRMTGARDARGNLAYAKRACHTCRVEQSQNQLVTAQLRERETNNGKARARRCSCNSRQR